MNIAVYAKTNANEKCHLKLTGTLLLALFTKNKSLGFTVVQVHTSVILFYEPAALY